MALKDAYILIPRTGQYVTSYGKRVFADVIELRILRRGDFPGLSGWPDATTQALVNEGGMWESQCLRQTERCENSLRLVLKMEAGALSQETQKWNKA